MTDALWQLWRADWRWMEDMARRRGWETTPISAAPPADEDAIRRVEAAAGLIMPPELREVLTRYSASVRFGWRIPSHLQAMERRHFPTSSFNRDVVWDLERIETGAIPNFFDWKRRLSMVDRSEAPNTPDMWERQFPFHELVNGDMLTIDMREKDGPRPVRYFSHELAVLHGQALAPDFFTFVTEMARLGQAGTEWASWARFGEWADDRYSLRSDSAGGREWRDWLEGDLNAASSDDPPVVIVGETGKERDLLMAARSGDATAAVAALRAGARPDVVWNSEWEGENRSTDDDEFATALTHAVRRNDIALAERLLALGATLNTRRLPVAEAVSSASLPTLKWLVSNGARTNGWKDERHWPLHLLLMRRSRYVATSRAELERRLREEASNVAGMPPALAAVVRGGQETTIAAELALFLEQKDYLEMLEVLLRAGADPDARWDNGATMLMGATPDTARILLRHGADPNARSAGGMTPLHHVRSGDAARLLVEAGADINALASPGGRKSESDPVHTPLQSSLALSPYQGLEVPRTLLELGADPMKRDGDGFQTLTYATSVPAFELMESYGLDPLERMPDGGTLLHNLFRRMGGISAHSPREVSMLDLLLSRGIDINARNGAGQTILHLAAQNAVVVDSITLLLERGADKAVRDRAGNRAVDNVPRSGSDIHPTLNQSRNEIRAALK